ncbi:MAG: DUF4868 domain-containing protein [Bacteroidaceae bacterium]|nr:DUF4868 domain-containing protein [Bacteroidaceae bacterium]
MALGDNFSALVFFATRSADGIVLKKANMKAEVLTGIAEGYQDSLRSELERFAHDDQMAVLNLSDRDERTNVIYRYDIPDAEPSYFDVMKEPISEPAVEYTEQKLFNFTDDSFSDIDYFVILLGSEDNHIVVYRDNFNVNLMKQARGRFYLNRSGTQIDKLDSDILRMDSQIDCMLIDDDFYIVNLKNLDTSREFATIIQRRANDAVDQIAELPFVDNVDGLREHLEDLPFARRLMRAMDNSPVTLLPAIDVLNFVRGHQILSQRLRINGDKFDLTSKRAQSAFVSLLNDDFLYSKLTQKDYETTSKGEMRD